MTQDQWPMLQELLHLKHQKDAQTLAKLTSWEAELITKHDALGRGEHDVTPEMLSIGQDILWEKWVQQQRSTIVASISTISAAKNAEKQKLMQSARKLKGVDKMCASRQASNRFAKSRKTQANTLNTLVNNRLHILARDISD